MHDLDHRVEQRFDLVGDGSNLEQPAIEVAQLHHSFDFGRLRFLIGRCVSSCSLVVQGEHQLDLAEGELVVMKDLGLLFLLAVDQQLRPRVYRRDREVTAVEDHLRVMRLERRGLDGHVVGAGLADRGHALVDPEDAWATLRHDPLEARHTAGTITDRTA